MGQETKGQQGRKRDRVIQHKGGEMRRTRDTSSCNCTASPVLVVGLVADLPPGNSEPRQHTHRALLTVEPCAQT